MTGIMTVRAPDVLQEFLKDKAREQGLTRNALILQILWEWADNNEEPRKRMLTGYINDG